MRMSNGLLNRRQVGFESPLTQGNNMEEKLETIWNDEYKVSLDEFIADLQGFEKKYSSTHTDLSIVNFPDNVFELRGKPR